MTDNTLPRVAADGGSRYAALFESFPDPLLVFGSPDGEEGSPETAGESVVHEVNEAFETTFGAEYDAVAGSPLDEVALTGSLVPDRDVDTTIAAADETAEIDDAIDPSATTTAGSILDRVRETGFAVRFRHATDGQTCHFRVRAITTDPADERGYLLFTDVTELERQRRDLARMVARLERVASVASHDLRNPLEVAEIRLEAARDTGEAVHFEKVAGALDRIEQIVQDVLAVGGGVDPTDAVSIEDVAETAWETVDTADATLVTSSGLPTVRGDADRLRQLFENLFRNSVEHGSTGSRPQADDSVEHGSTRSQSQSDDDGGDVTVTVEPFQDGFAVVDDGPGIPEELHERAFEAGFSTEPVNSGLGLSIVGQIAREHGWHVSLASDQRVSVDDSCGARFEFTGVE